jgi:hypothetical protein
MTVYVAGTLLGVAFAKLASSDSINGKKLSKGFKKLFELLAILPFVVIAGCRVDVGTDYGSYAKLYENPEFLTSHFAEGFSLMVNILRKFSQNSRFFFIATSFFIYAPYVHTAIKESDNAAFSVLFMVISEDYFVSMNGISQFLAIAFIWVAAMSLLKGQWIKSIILCLLAATFHRSSLFFLIPMALYKCKLSIKQLIAAVAGTCIAGILGKKYMVSLIIQFTSYGDYFSSNYANSQMTVAMPLMLIYVVMLIAMMLLTDLDEVDKDPKSRMFMISVLMSAAIMLMSYFLTSNTYRLIYYFSGIIGLCFPSILHKIRRQKDRYIVEMAVIVLFTIWTTMLIMHNNQNALPYNWIL